MRNNFYQVPVYSMHWMSGDKPLCHIKVSEAEEILAVRQARRIGLKKGAFSIQLRQPRRADERSKATITISEMEANAAGAANPRLRKRPKDRHSLLVGNFIDRAMTKVEEWPFAGDTKAVRVGPLPVCV